MQQEIEERPTRRLFPVRCRVADVISDIRNTELGDSLWFTLTRCQYLRKCSSERWAGLTCD
jgi:hypothetical protein